MVEGLVSCQLHRRRYERRSWFRLDSCDPHARWACRLRLPLVKVRIERVQSISEADAWAEGYGEHWQQRVKEAGADGPLGRPDPRGWFAMLWDKLYGTWGRILGSRFTSGDGLR